MLSKKAHEIKLSNRLITKLSEFKLYIYIMILFQDMGRDCLPDENDKQK